MASRVLIGVVALIGVAAMAHAGPAGVIVESARTAAHSVRDGVLTFARTTRAFVLGGPRAAEETWYDNAEATREHARWNAERVREEAGVARGPAYREYHDEEPEYYHDDGRDYRDDHYDYRDEPLPPAEDDYRR